MSVPLSGIRTYIEKVKQGVSIERPIEKVRAERDRITAEYRGLLPDEAARKQFDELLGCAKTVFPYVENHLFYVEHWFHSLFWNKVREVGAILKTHGVIADVEDVWLLRRDEIKSALWDVVTAWATGVTPRGTQTWPREIAWRKGVMQKFKEWNAPPAIGKAPEVIQEPFTIVLWGVTNKSLGDWASVQDAKDPSSVTELKGFAGSPGVVEGKARVCKSVNEVSLLRRRDPGGADHLAVLGAGLRQDRPASPTSAGDEPRRHRLPRVRVAGGGGTGHATKVIRTGMRLRRRSTGVVAIVR
jgi:pyruvate,water dikinase